MLYPHLWPRVIPEHIHHGPDAPGCVGFLISPAHFWPGKQRVTCVLAVIVWGEIETNLSPVAVNDHSCKGDKMTPDSKQSNCSTPSSMKQFLLFLMINGHQLIGPCLFSTHPLWQTVGRLVCIGRGYSAIWELCSSWLQSHYPMSPGQIWCQPCCMFDLQLEIDCF